MLNCGVVIPVGPGRVENLAEVLRALSVQTVQPRVVVIVCDGPEAALQIEGGGFPVPLATLQAPEKHEPGKEQPRNIGARLLGDLGKQDPRFAGITHVWFLDSDVIVGEDCLSAYAEAMEQEPIDRILIGPYDWMAPGQREPHPELENDPRWASFREYEPFEILRGDLSAGLACFSGNLVWPLAEFQRVGGFWDELHHGRCEDGELGLRAVAMGVPISYVREARGWHLWHDFDPAVVRARNARDVPMINERHPWVEGDGGLFVVEEDGARFDTTCPNCGLTIRTADIWSHREDCGDESQPLYPTPTE